MTTPHQSPPDLAKLVGMGAFQVGNAAQNWGQQVTETFTRVLVYGPGAALGAAFTSLPAFLAALRDYLMTLPLEALKIFQAFIPGALAGAFNTITSAVDTIINALSLGNLRMYLSDFQNWLSGVYTILQTEVHQFLDVINGVIVVPITARISNFILWWSSVGSQLADAAKAASDIASLVANAAVANAAAAGAAIAQAGTNANAALAKFTTLLSNAGAGGEAALGNLISTLNTIVNQILGIINGLAVTPINSAVAGFQDWHTSLNTFQTTTTTNIQGIIDTAVNAMGITGANKTLTQLSAALQQIPHANVLGVLGAADVGNAIQNVLDGGVQALTNAPSSVNNTIAGFKGYLSQLTGLLGYSPGGAPPAASVSGITNTNNAFIALTAGSKPAKNAMDPTADSPFDLQMLFGQASVPIIAVAQSSPRGCFIPTPHGGIKKSITWMGYPTGGSMAPFTAFYINIYRVNTTTGALTLVHESADIKGSVASTSTPDWNAYNIPSGSWITTKQSEVYYVEFEVWGGTYNVGGLSHPVANHPTAKPANWAAIRTQTGGHTVPTTFGEPGSGGSPLAYTGDTPWAGFAGAPGQTIYSPVLIPYDTRGTFSETNPAVTFPWANHFDVIVCGAGGGGSAGGTFQGSVAGAPGAWVAATLTKAQMGSANLTMRRGQGGGGGASLSAAGGAGQSSYVTISGYGTLTGNGGAGGFGANGTLYGSPGAGPGNKDWADFYNVTHTYYGGAGGGSPQAGGGQPGGAGAGGNATITGAWVYGGAGGDGVVFILAYQ